MKKKTNFGAAIALAGITAFTSTQVSALAIIAGDQKWVLDGFSTFEDSSLTQIGIPDGTSGNLWGIASVTSISNKSALGTFTNTVYSRPLGGAAGEYLTIRFGNLDLRYDGSGLGGADAAGNPNSGYAVTDGGAPFATASPITFSHNAYFGHDDGADNALAGNLDTTANGKAYAQIWSTGAGGSDPFETDVLAGIGAGAGSLGSFGATTAAGTLLVDLEFAAGGILLDELAGPLGASAGSVASDVFRSVAGSTTQNATLGYLDVVGGTIADNYDTNTFHAGNALLAGLGRADGFDVRLEASNSAETAVVPAPVSGAGWDSAIESSSALTHAIPEPGVIALMGLGLLGVAGASRKRRQA